MISQTTAERGIEVTLETYGRDVPVELRPACAHKPPQYGWMFHPGWAGVSRRAEHTHRKLFHNHLLQMFTVQQIHLENSNKLQIKFDYKIHKNTCISLGLSIFSDGFILLNKKKIIEQIEIKHMVLYILQIFSSIWQT